jgi:dipeptidase
MCDTFVYRDNNHKSNSVWFCKNSDREPDEPQLVEYHPAYTGQNQQATTYLNIDVPNQRSAVLLSRPSWIWGAEIGVNEHGVAIGNEAVYTRLIQKTGTALLGMDLLRIALEQAQTAESACNIIIQYLQKYGQGGPAGYRDKKFRYDNSFMVSDHDESFILETAGKFWAKKRVSTMAAISNDLSLTTDYDEISPAAKSFALHKGWWNGKDEFDFRAVFRTRFMPWAARSKQRRECNLRNLQQLSPAAVDEQSFIPLLRAHKRNKPSSNADVCMHAKGLLRPSATTNSMIAKLTTNAMPQVWSSFGQPCQNEFKPVDLTAVSI